MLRIIHVRTKQCIGVQCFFPAEYNFLTLRLMYICTTGYLCNAMQQIVLEISCGFILFPHFQISFSSIALDCKIFSHNIPNNMISKQKVSTSKNLDVATCCSKDFNRELWSYLTCFHNNLFRANFKKLFECNKCVIIFYCKSNDNLQSHSNHDIVFNCNFRWSLDFIKYFMARILNTTQHSPRYIE